MKKFMKALAVVFCAAILVAGSITATLAYLATKTDPIDNTFTAGDINIELTPSSSNDVTMIPGADIAMNPKVTVTTGSEDCWLFIKVTEENHFADYMTYSVDTGDTQWKALDGKPGVYYRHVKAADAGADLSILKDNKVTALATCTKDDYNAIPGDKLPTLSFTAYAVQYIGFETNVVGAWEIAAALETSANS